MDIYSVYWIHRQSHNNPYVEGYVGVSKNVIKRIKQHKKTKGTIIYNVLQNHDTQVSILRTYGSLHDALQAEKNYRPKPKIGWNICEGGGAPPCEKGVMHHNFGRKHSIETKTLLSEKKKGINHPNYGKPLPLTTRVKIREAQLGEKNHRYGKCNTKESNDARSLALKNIKKQSVVCPHCKKEGGKPVMYRFHMENCKLRSI